MTTPFPFVSGAVLTASNLNSITELPTRTLTATGNAVSADRYSRVILNGSSISYTVNSATFDVGEVVEIYNANSTTATIAAGTGGVTINAAAGLTLAQFQAAKLYAVSSTSFILWKSDVTQTAAGLELVKSQTVGSGVSTVTVTNAFSSSYTNYRVVMSNVDASLADQAMTFTLGGSTASYYSAMRAASYAGGTIEANRNNQASAFLWITSADNNTNGSFDIYQPNLAQFTTWAGTAFGFTYAVWFGGLHTVATAYTDFTVGAGAGTFTGGTIKVYGYRD